MLVVELAMLVLLLLTREIVNPVLVKLFFWLGGFLTALVTGDLTTTLLVALANPLLLTGLMKPMEEAWVRLVGFFRSVLEGGLVFLVAHLDRLLLTGEKVNSEIGVFMQGGLLWPVLLGGFVITLLFKGLVKTLLLEGLVLQLLLLVLVNSVTFGMVLSGWLGGFGCFIW